LSPGQVFKFKRGVGTIVFVHVTTSFRSQQGVTVQTAAPSRPLIHTPIYLTIRLKTHIYHTIMRQREQLANVNISHMCDVRLSAGKAHRSLRSSLPPQVQFRRSCYTGQDGTGQDLPHPPADPRTRGCANCPNLLRYFRLHFPWSAA